MTAKEYLSQYRAAEVKTKHREKQLAELRSTLCAAGINISEKVQTSPKDSMSEDVARVIDLEAEIRAEKLRLEEFKHKIINEIHQLENPLFVQILYKRYIECKSLWEISDEINYAYRHVKRLHGHALQEFYRKILRDAVNHASP